MEEQAEMNNKNQRIELHCHTKMSQMDGIASPTELIMRAEDLGHRAVVKYFTCSQRHTP